MDGREGGALNPLLVVEERGQAMDPPPEDVAFVVEVEAESPRPRTKREELEIFDRFLASHWHNNLALYIVFNKWKMEDVIEDQLISLLNKIIQKNNSMKGQANESLLDLARNMRETFVKTVSEMLILYLDKDKAI